MGKLKNLNVAKSDVTDLQTLEPSFGLSIAAPEEALKNGCPVLLGSCLTDGAIPMTKAGPVKGFKPGQKIQINSTAEVNLHGLSLSVKLE